MKKKIFIKTLTLTILFIVIGFSFYWIVSAQEKEENPILQQKIDDSQQKIEELEEQVSQIASLQEEIKQLKKQLKEKEMDNASLAKTNQSLNEKIDELEKEIANSSWCNNKNTESNNSPESNDSKKVYLTFDDGPSSLTPEILAILNEHHVNGTFFTIGKNMEKYPEIAKRTYNEGNMILTHSYTHDYAIYESLDTFYSDLEKAETAYENILGMKAPTILRFPGGSTNQVSFSYGGKQLMTELTADIREKGYDYIDWNVSSGDASDIADQPNKMLKRIKNTTKGKDTAVALFHDTAAKNETLEILPEVIEFYKEEGYKFETFRDISEEELNHLVSTGVANKVIVR